jgi:outer membrane protein TolC
MRPVSGQLSRSIRTFGVALAVMLSAGVTRADDGQDIGRELNLDQALAAARRSNHTVIAERSRLVSAQATVDKAWTVLFPTIAAQGKYTRNNIGFQFSLPDMATGTVSTLTIQPVNQLDGTLNATVPLLVPAAYPGLKAVNMNAKVTEENVRAAEESVLFGVAQTFYAAAIADEVLVARRSSIQVARATLENAKTRFSAGTVTKVDVDRAELAVLRAEQFERETKTAREQTYRALSTLIQEQQPFRVRVSPTVVAPASESIAASNDLSGTLHLRPEFRALEAMVAAEQAEQRSHAWRWAPSLSGFGLGRVFNYDNFARKSYSWAVGAQLDWVIYDAGVRDTQRRIAAAQAVEAQARAQVFSDSVRDDLVNSRRQLETKGQAQQTFERAVQLAHETIDLVRIQYEAGQATQIDLLQAQDNLVAAQEALAQAHFDVAVADLTLRRASGSFPGR